LRATAQPLITDYIARASAKGVDAEAVLAHIRSQMP
jgi:hypothetical protein